MEGLNLDVEVVDLEQHEKIPARGTDSEYEMNFLGDLESVSEQERLEILADIEKVVSTTPITIAKKSVAGISAKRGSLFPLLINILALTAVAATVYISALFFELRKSDLQTESRLLISTEGRLLEEFRRRSERDLALKDQEISGIQQELARLDLQSRELRLNLESELINREQELRSRMAEELEIERQALLQAGISDAAIAERIAELETQKNSTLLNELEALRLQNEEQIRFQEAELDRTRALAEEILAQANAEKTQLLEELQEQERNIRDQFEEERRAIETEAADELRRVIRLQEQETLISDQIVAGYRNMMDLMENDLGPEALEAAGRIRTLLTNPAIDSMPRLARRRPVDYLVLDKLEDEIRLSTRRGPDTAPALLEAADLLLQARALVTAADDSAEAGESERARSLYNQAIQRIPEMARAAGELLLFERETLESGFLRQIDAQELESDNKINELEGELTALRRNTSALIDNLNRDLEELRNELAYSERLRAELEAREPFETVVKETVVDEEALMQYRAEISRLEAALATALTEARDLEKALDEVQQEAALLAETQQPPGEIEFVEDTERLSELTRELKNINERVADEIRKREEAEQQLQGLQQNLSELQRENRSQQEELDAAIEEIATLLQARRGDERYAAVALLYSDYRQEIDGLIRSNNFREADRILDNFLKEDRIASLLPGLDNVIRNIRENVVSDSELVDINRSRINALQDIRNAIQILDDNPLAEIRSSSSPLHADSENDFRETISAIQQLTVNQMRRQIAAVASEKDGFAGSVESIDNSLLRIRSYAQSPPVAGTSLVIRRYTSNAFSDIAIAEIESSENNILLARIIERSGPLPRMLDLAYRR